jgi:hypothetical protein
MAGRVCPSWRLAQRLPGSWQEPIIASRARPNRAAASRQKQSRCQAEGAAWPRPSAGAKRDFYLCPVPPLQRPSVPGEPFGSP